MAQKKPRISIPNSFFIWRISIFFFWRISIPNSFLVWRISIPKLPVRSLLCNPMRNPLFWPLSHLGLFEIDLGYWSSKLKMRLGYWSSKRKRYWSSKSKMSLGYWSSAFFGPFCKGRFFFQRAGREGSDQNFFLPRVPKFKLDQTDWLHDLSFYPPFTQVQEITVKDRTIVTGHPVYVSFNFMVIFRNGFFKNYWSSKSNWKLIGIQPWWKQNLFDVVHAFLLHFVAFSR